LAQVLKSISPRRSTSAEIRWVVCGGCGLLHKRPSTVDWSPDSSELLVNTVSQKCWSTWRVPVKWFETDPHLELHQLAAGPSQPDPAARS